MSFYDNAAGRIWIFLTSRPLLEIEKTDISNTVSAFCKTWNAHGTPLESNFEIKYDHVLLFAVNELVEAASGCSIDKVTQLFAKINDQYSLELFDRLKYGFLTDSSKLTLINAKNLQESYNQGKIGEDSIFIDTSISQIADYKNRGEVSLKNTWLYRRISAVQTKE